MVCLSAPLVGTLIQGSALALGAPRTLPAPGNYPTPSFPLTATPAQPTVAYSFIFKMLLLSTA